MQRQQHGPQTQQIGIGQADFSPQSPWWLSEQDESDDGAQFSTITQKPADTSQPSPPVGGILAISSVTENSMERRRSISTRHYVNRH
jgi:hypothetical protein